jgi:trk system potassium uptake protein TrkA
LLTLRDVGAAFIEMQVPEDSPIVGIPMSELSLPEHFLVALVIRDGQAVIPKGSTKLLAGDEVVAVTAIEQENVLDRLFRGELIRKR